MPPKNRNVNSFSSGFSLTMSVANTLLASRELKQSALSFPLFTGLV